MEFWDKWKDWIFLALTIPVGIFVNLVSPSIDAYLKHRSLSARERKIKTLLIRYITIKNQREHHKFINEIRYNFWRDVILVTISMGLYILIFELIPEFSWVRAILVFVASLPMYYFAVLLFRSLAYMTDFVHFDSFKRRTIKKLKRLGCNLRDYGIE